MDGNDNKINKIYVRVNRSTIALYILHKLLGIDFVKLVCLYEVYKEDIFFLFMILEGTNVVFADNTIKFLDKTELTKLFERAENIHKWLLYKTSNVKRYDIKICRELEKIYQKGQFIIEKEECTIPEKKL